jgi:uncharacterized protein (DUF58 family)
MAFGGRFFLLMAAGLLWIGPAWRDHRALIGLAIWDVLVLAAWAWDFFSLPRPQDFEIARVWRAPLGLRMAGQAELEVRNGSARAVWTRLVDDVPASLRREPPTVDIQAIARSTSSGSYSVTPGERGNLTLGRVFLRYRSHLQLAERWAVADLGQSVRVYPNFDSVKRHAIHLLRSRYLEQQIRRARTRGLGREFESLREFRDGDDPRDICWTASARRGTVVSKIHRMERSQTVWILLDAGRLLRARVDGLTKLDYAVDAALALAQMALGSGDRVGLVAYGRRVQHRLPAGRGAAHLRALVERLALVRTEPFEADHLGAAEEVLAVQKRRSLVVWLTELAETASIPEVVEVASRMMPRHLVLFTVITQPDLALLAGRCPTNPEQLYASMAAQEMVQRREVLLRNLRQRGAIAIEVQPAKVSAGIINRYLEIKERNAL